VLRRVGRRRGISVRIIASRHDVQGVCRGENAHDHVVDATLGNLAICNSVLERLAKVAIVRHLLVKAVQSSIDCAMGCTLVKEEEEKEEEGGES
jgi:hypothetical protein